MKSLSVFLLAAALGAGLPGCGRHETEAPAGDVAGPPLEVDVIPVEWSERPLDEPSVGTVRPHRQADVSAKLSGRVLKMLAVPGQRAEEGELLAEIDAGEIRAALTRAEALRDQAKRDFDRVALLLPKNAISRAEYEQAEARHQAAVASALEASRSLENAEVRAPFTGTITRKDMDPGDFAMPGRPLFGIEDSSRLQLETHVAESLAGALKTGDAIRVTVDSAKLDLEGKVVEISPSADAGSRTFLVKIDLPKAEALRAGQFGRAHVPRGTQRLIEVPESAVIARGQMEVAFVVEDGKARMRLVRSGLHEGGRVEVLSGIDAGETLMAAPGPGLRDGDPVLPKSP